MVFFFFVGKGEGENIREGMITGYLFHRAFILSVYTYWILKGKSFNFTRFFFVCVDTSMHVFNFTSLLGPTIEHFDTLRTIMLSRAIRIKTFVQKISPHPYPTPLPHGLNYDRRMITNTTP